MFLPCVNKSDEDDDDDDGDDDVKKSMKLVTCSV